MLVAAGLLLGAVACTGGQIRPERRGPAAESEAAEPSPEALGIAALSAEEVLERADEALAGAGGYRHVVDMWMSGMSVMGMDLTLDPEGGCAISFAVSLQGNVDVVRVGDLIWVRFSEELWEESGAELPEEYIGAYMHGPVQHPDLAMFSDMCDEASSGVLDLEGEEGMERTDLLVEEAPDHGGTPVIAVRSEESGAEGAVSSTYLVAAEGEPYPLQVTAEMDFTAMGATMTQVHDFSDFGATEEIGPPEDGPVVDIDEMDVVFPEEAFPTLPVAAAYPAGPGRG